MFLNECKYVVKKKNILEYVTKTYIEISSDDSDRENTDEEN